MPKHHKPNFTIIYYSVRDALKITNLEYAFLDYIKRVGRNRYKLDYQRFHDNVVPISRATYYRTIDKLKQEKLLLPSRKMANRLVTSRRFWKKVLRVQNSVNGQVLYAKVLNEYYYLFYNYNLLAYASILYSLSRYCSQKSIATWAAMSEKHTITLKKELNKIFDLHGVNDIEELFNH